MKEPKILLVDDEPLARQRMLRFLEELGFTGSYKTASNGQEAITLIQSFEPQIVFLDIQMPLLNGFEVLQHLEKPGFEFVFQTAFDEFAIKAFEVNACDYLLKPYSRERFAQALERALASHSRREDVLRLDQFLANEKKFLTRIQSRGHKNSQIIDVSSIESFISKDHYTIAQVANRELIIEMSLQWLEQQLNPADFIRIHRNAIIAVREIKSIGNTRNSEVELKSGRKLSLSKSHRRALLKLINELTELKAKL